MIQSSNANHANVFFAIHGVSLIKIFYHISTSVFHVIALWVMSLDGLENNLRLRLWLRIARRLEIRCDQGRKTIWYSKSQDSAASLIETDVWDNRYTLKKTCVIDQKKERMLLFKFKFLYLFFHQPYWPLSIRLWRKYFETVTSEMWKELKL